jgi:hypothetical protein
LDEKSVAQWARLWEAEMAEKWVQLKASPWAHLSALMMEETLVQQQAKWWVLPLECQ